MKKRKKLGVALGSGGPRGLYHVGVLKSLHKHNIPIDYLAGSSIGSWAGGFYALHRDPAMLEDLTGGHKIEKLMGMFEFSLGGGGVIKGDKLQKLLDEWLGHASFKDLRIPFQANATDFITGKSFVFKTGNLALALRASMAVSGVFSPIAYRGKVLIDGGISNPVPDDLVRAMGADVVLAVDLMTEIATPPSALKKDPPSIREVLGSTIDILCGHLCVATTRDADIIMRPHLGKYASWADYFLSNRSQEAIALGEKETDKIIPELKRKLAR